MASTEEGKAKIPRKKRKGAGVFFLRGLVTLLPVVLTIFILVLVFNFVTGYVTTPINRFIYWSLESNGLGWKALSLLDIEPYELKYLEPQRLPIAPVNLQSLGDKNDYEGDVFLEALATMRAGEESFFRDLDDLAIDRDRLRTDVKGVVPPWIGIVVSLFIVIWLGWVASGFFGRRIVALVERGLNAIPVLRSVYPYSKQFTEFVFGESKLDFDTVVCVPYPSEGLWSIGFVTNHGLKDARAATGKNLVSVFVPSSPMPMTGYTIFVDVSRLIPIPISVDEALRVTVSGGVLIPPSQAVHAPQDELRAALHLPPLDADADERGDDEEARA